MDEWIPIMQDHIPGHEIYAIIWTLELESEEP